jgi:polyisoprenoid-binding protein YceI
MAALVLAGLAGVQAADYKIDADHSAVSFKIRHLIGKVNGRFDKFEGMITYDAANPKAWKAKAVIDAASINTNTPKRDDHLRSDDFFDVKVYPTLVFASKKVTDVKGSTAKLVGDLTLHGVTKPVTLDMEVLGVGKDPWGNTRASFTASTKINRKDFGLNWNEAIETGGVLVGDEVEITLETEAILQ